MPFKTPKFWYQAPGIHSTLLTPLAWIYQTGHLLNTSFQKKKKYVSSLPVICVGNAVAGGSGKTPCTIALTQLIKSELAFKNPYILTRGYGGNIEQPTLVDVSTHTAFDVGDEALLLAQHAPTVVSSDRAKGAKFIEEQIEEQGVEQSANIIIMDDGLQSQTLHHTIRILVIDRSMDFGNGKTIPAGPLREPLKNLLPSIHAVIAIGSKLMAEQPSFSAEINPDITNIKTDQKFIAFAGIGKPEKFKTTLEKLNLNIIGWHEFSDHHPYTTNDLQELTKEAKNKNANLITTEKDYVRLSNNLNDEHVKQIKTLPISLHFHEETDLKSFLKEKLYS